MTEVFNARMRAEARPKMLRLDDVDETQIVALF